MNFSISITISLDSYDKKVQAYCDDNQYDYDVPDYTRLIRLIEYDLEQLEGVEEVIFNHSSWIKFDLGIDDFSKAKAETEIVKEEIRQVFANHGVK